MVKSASAHVVAPGFGFDPGPPCTRSVHVKEIHQMPDLKILLLKGSLLYPAERVFRFRCWRCCRHQTEYRASNRNCHEEVLSFQKKPISRSLTPWEDSRSPWSWTLHNILDFVWTLLQIIQSLSPIVVDMCNRFRLSFAYGRSAAPAA